jgi:hypothetical protein
MEYIEDETVAADVCEIIEALLSRFVANSTDELMDLVDRCRGSLIPAEAVDLLAVAATIFENRRGQDPLRFLFTKNKAAEDVAEGLRDLFPFWPYFVYHGTSSKALPSIMESGLIAGYGRSRWEGIVDEEYLDSGVFLTEGWRTAIDWAQSTALTRDHRLRKDGSKPAIIRIRAEHIDLYQDSRARRPGCLLSLDGVNVEDADVFVFEDVEAPSRLLVWRPLDQTLPSAQYPQAKESMSLIG